MFCHSSVSLIAFSLPHPQSRCFPLPHASQLPTPCHAPPPTLQVSKLPRPTEPLKKRAAKKSKHLQAQSAVAAKVGAWPHGCIVAWMLRCMAKLGDCLVASGAWAHSTYSRLQFLRGGCNSELRTSWELVYLSVRLKKDWMPPCAELTTVHERPLQPFGGEVCTQGVWQETQGVLGADRLAGDSLKDKLSNGRFISTPCKVTAPEVMALPTSG